MSDTKRFNIDIVSRGVPSDPRGRNLDLLSTVAEFNTLGMTVEHFIAAGPGGGNPSYTVSGTETNFQMWLDRCYQEGETASEYEVQTGSQRDSLTERTSEQRVAAG